MKNILVLVFFILFHSVPAFSQGYTGLVGRWTFNGNANDTSGHGLNGIVHGATLTTGLYGLPNTAYKFNGRSDYITIPYDSIMNTKIHSFCVLIKPTGFYSGNSQGNAIIERGREWTTTFSYQLEFFDNAYDNSDVVFTPTQDVFAGWTGYMTSSTPQIDWYYTPTVDSDTWYNVVLTYDGDTTKIYVDGILMNTFFNPCTFSGSTDSLNFGKSEDATPYPFWLNGTIDEIRFYNRVLSPSEISMFGDSLGNGRIIPIKFYLDANGDCIKQTTEPYSILPIKIAVDSNGITVDTLSTTSSLYYYAYGNPGDIYSFRVISCSANIYVTCPSSGILIDTLKTGINPTKYVGLSCYSSTAFDLGENLGVSTDVNGEALDVQVSNAYCSSEPAILTLNFSPQYIFGSAFPAPATVSGNTATWNLGSVSYLNSPVNIHVLLNVPGLPLTPGDTVTAKCVVTPITGDIDTSNNTIIKTDTVRICRDPNEMTVIPNGCISPGTDTALQYTIQFENTGNDTAHFIYIMDTLSDYLNPRSLSIVSASNMMNVSKWYDNTYHNIYKFEFPYINLLDSSHHNQCTGMLTFNINTKTAIPLGATIFNHAGIFFDDNSVVMTDTVENMIGGCATGDLSSNLPTIIKGVQIYPNPATNELTIKMNQGAYNSFSITNNIGQEIIQQPLTLTQTNVNVNTLPPGLYYIIFRGDNGTQMQKFVRM